MTAQTTFAFMDDATTSANAASANAASTKPSTKSNSTSPSPGNQSPGKAKTRSIGKSPAPGKSSLLFPLEPYVRTASKVAASRSSSCILPEKCEQMPSDSSPAADRQAVLQKLRAQTNGLLGKHGIGDDPQGRYQMFSTGSVAMDETLLCGGLRMNAISEWIADTEGSGAAALSLRVAANCLRSPKGQRPPTGQAPFRTEPSAGPMVVVDLQNDFYPPAAVALGIPAERMILVRPSSYRDAVWAIDQSLRCQSVAAVWAMVPARLDDRDARRLQLAAEQGCTPGFLVRPSVVRGKPSFSDVRLHVRKAVPKWMSDSQSISSEPTPLQVTLDHGRGVSLGQSVWIQIKANAELQEVIDPRKTNHETAAMHLASQLANPKSAHSRDRASKQRRLA